MRSMSLGDLILMYIQDCKEDTSDYVTYIERFHKQAENTHELYKYIYSSDKPKQLKYPKLLSMTPDQILELNDGLTELSKLIYAFIKTLPFTERLVAARQFNEMFSYGKMGDFAFSELTEWDTDNSDEDEKEHNYFTINRLFDQTELEILLLKRLQIDEFTTLLRTRQTIQIRGIRKNRDSRIRISRELGTTTQSLLPYLRRLEKGINLLGHDVKIDLGRNGVYYDNSVHPIFLTLNPSEATLLTVHLKRTYSRTDRSVIANKIADDIYSQLSEQVREKIDEQAKELGVCFPKDAERQIELRRYRQEKDDDEGYKPEIAQKRASRFDIVLKSEPSKNHTGILKWKDNDIYILENEDGTPALKDENDKAQIIHRDDIIYYRFIDFK